MIALGLAVTVEFEDFFNSCFDCVTFDILFNNPIHCSSDWIYKKIF
jgi:hypothetical protein